MPYKDDEQTTEDDENIDEYRYKILEGEDLVNGITKVMAIDDVTYRIPTKEDEEGNVVIDHAKVYVNLVNTSGSMVKKKSAAKDGSEHKFNVDNYEIQYVSIDE